MKVHTLANGATVILTSLHGAKFSDGTECEGQDKSLVDQLTLKREETHMQTIKGMVCNQVRFILSPEQITLLINLSQQADIVWVSLPLLTALREHDDELRDSMPNVVAMNRTKETARVEKPQDAVVDINNWSY
jgi:hypothetical protein